MFPSRCIHEPCRNIEVMTLMGWWPGSVTHTIPSPIGNPAPGGSAPVNSPGIRPRLQTEVASASDDPPPCTTIHTSTLMATNSIVTWAGRCVSFSS